MKQTLTLEIAGTKFRLVADADADHLRDLARLVNERVDALRGGSRTASSAQLLAMVALGLADDLKLAEKRIEEIDAMTRSAVRSAIERIDQHLEREPADSADA